MVKWFGNNIFFSWWWIFWRKSFLNFWKLRKRNDFPQKSHLKYLQTSWMILLCDFVVNVILMANVLCAQQPRTLHIVKPSTKSQCNFHCAMLDAGANYWCVRKNTVALEAGLPICNTDCLMLCPQLLVWRS